MRRLSYLILSPPRLQPPLTASTPDKLISLLKICGSNLSPLKQAHCSMITGGLDHDNLIVAKFVEACSAAGYVQYACSVFTHQPNPNTYLYNTMIRALSNTDEHKAYGAAVMVYRKFQASCLRPDTYTFPFVLKVVIKLSDVWLGRQIHGQTLIAESESSVHVVTSLIQMYSSCGATRDARKVFDETCVRDMAVWNALIAGYAKIGEMDEAEILLQMMPCCSRNVVSWTTVISGYVKCGQASEAIEVFKKMQMENVKPDEVTVLAALSACADLGALELGLAVHGLSHEALQMFNRMVEAGVKPNEVTFVAVLSACSHVGLVDLGRWYFGTMKSKYGIEPKTQHYGCMIDLLGRAGFLKEAEELATKMPFESNAAIWGSLLAASYVHCELDLGERALKRLIQLEPNNSGNYMLLSNLYSNLERWNESKALRKMMRHTSVKKMAGGSSICVRDRVNRFVSGDASHPRINQICELLQNIDLQIQSNGD